MQQEERFEENKTFVIENKEAIEEIETDILEQFLKTSEHRRARAPSEVETNKKNKFNIKIGNIALDRVIKDIKQKDITALN